MFYTVYRVTNCVNGKFYIGCHRTRDIADGYLGSGTLIQRAIRKYGSSAFVKEIIALCDCAEQMYEREKLEIAPHWGQPYFYNLHRGGRGGWEHAKEACYHGRKIWVVCPMTRKTRRIYRRDFADYVREGWLWGRKLAA